jgi:hypothetical protein
VPLLVIRRELEVPSPQPGARRDDLPSDLSCGRQQRLLQAIGRAPDRHGSHPAREGREQSRLITMLHQIRRVEFVEPTA